MRYTKIAKHKNLTSNNWKGIYSYGALRCDLEYRDLSEFEDGYGSLYNTIRVLNDVRLVCNTN